MTKLNANVRESTIQSASGLNSSVREELNLMWTHEGVGEDEINKDNMTNDIAYKLIERGRSGDDVDGEFAKLTYEQIIEKYGYTLSPKLPVVNRG